MPRTSLGTKITEEGGLRFVINGKTQCLSDWAKEYDLPKITLWQRVKNQKMPFEKALILVRHRGYGKKSRSK
jgi:hypothetical protein